MLALDEAYGRPQWSSRYAPVDELIYTVLSQNTADVNTERSFAALRQRFPSWEQVRDADPDEIADGHRARWARAGQGAAHQGDPGRPERTYRAARPL